MEAPLGRSHLSRDLKETKNVGGKRFQADKQQMQSPWGELKKQQGGQCDQGGVNGRGMQGESRAGSCGASWATVRALGFIPCVENPWKV